MTSSVLASTLIGLAAHGATEKLENQVDAYSHT